MDEDASWHPGPVVLVNMTTQETIIFHSNQAILQTSFLLNENNNLFRICPASSESINAMREVQTDTEGECSICLETIEGTAKEMTCFHRFHGQCIERWLKVRGSCPLCRFMMQEEEVKSEGEGWRRGVWVRLHVSR